MEHDDVEISLNHDHFVLFADFIAGIIQAVENVAFTVQRRFRRIDILGRFALF